MIPAALEWFVNLCTKYVAAPSEAQLLGRDIVKQLKSKNHRIQLNRVFKRHNTSLPLIYSWLSDAVMSTAIETGGCSFSKYTYKLTVAAIQEILSGELASKAWGMCKRRGAGANFSTTQEAAALVGYLTKIAEVDWLPQNIYPASEELSEEYLLLAYLENKRNCISGKLFTQEAALKITSKLFEVNEDNIRKYVGIDPVDDQAEAGLAAYGLGRLGLLSAANNYFDVVELMALATKNSPLIKKDYLQKVSDHLDTKDAQEDTAKNVTI